MLRGETIAFHIYSLANISRGDKYPATIQLYSQYIPFFTIKFVNPPLCFHHQDFWRLKHNFWWLNMCLLAITQKITGLVESGTLREIMLIKCSSIFHHISGCFPYFFPETNPSWDQYFIYTSIFFFHSCYNWLLETNPGRKRWDGFEWIFLQDFDSKEVDGPRPVGVLDEGVAPVRSVETRGKPRENCDFIGENGGFTFKKIGIH